MRYQPNFCNNCGEKIERPAPSLTDSTRFCDVCKHEFLPVRAAPVAFAALMAVFGIFGIGSYLRSGGEKAPNVASKPFAANPASAVKNPANSASPPVSNPANVSRATSNVNTQTVATPSNPAIKPPARPEKPNFTEEAVYFCGAATKKGTPCSRRVRGGGRCWQHKGQTAMVGDEKLLAAQ